MEKKEAKTNDKIRWWGTGDINAFFGLMLDNVTNLVLLSAILSGGFGYPIEFIIRRMIPGTALGVLIGDAVYTWMAINLARREGRNTVTAMPLGLDTPSTIGIAACVIGPTWVASHDADVTWHVAMGVLICIGIVKVIFSFIGGWIQKSFPQAGLLGSIGGVGLALLGFLPLVNIFETPIVGITAFGIIVWTLVAGLKPPLRLPGAFAAVIAGTLIHHILGGAGILPQYEPPSMKITPALPLPSAGWLNSFPQAIKYLPIAIPFGLLTIVGGINVNESARVAGDNFNTRNILLTEAISTLIAGFFGGVAQSTPYIGHPAYKSMGARAAYTLATGLFIFLSSTIGIIPVIIKILPVSAVCPILVFVGLEIISQSFTATQKRHISAVSVSYLPSIASLVLIYFDNFQQQFATAIHTASSKIPNVEKIVSLTDGFVSLHQTIRLLGHGFILTAMLWGGIVALLIDKRFKFAGILLLICSFFSLFGVIHSVAPFGDLYLPWKIKSGAVWQIAFVYFLFGILAILKKQEINSINPFP